MKHETQEYRPRHVHDDLYARLTQHAQKRMQDIITSCLHFHVALCSFGSLAAMKVLMCLSLLSSDGLGSFLKDIKRSIFFQMDAELSAAHSCYSCCVLHVTLCD